MRAFVYADNDAQEMAFAECAERFGTADLVWLHLDGRSEQAQSWIKGRADVPPIVREALYATETRPRAELMDDGAIINLRGLAADPDDGDDVLVSIRCWVEAGRVISFAYRKAASLEAVIAAFLAGNVLDPGDLVVAFAREMSAGLDGVVAQIGDSLDSMESMLDASYTRKPRRLVGRIRGEAISYRRFVVPQREALERLGRSDLAWLEDGDRQALLSAADRFARMAEELAAVRDRSTIVHDELTDLRGELIDQRSLLISIVAMIFLPLTFITGLLGMNVQGIPYAMQPWAFWGVVAFCVATGLMVLGWFAWAHWLQED